MKFEATTGGKGESAVLHWLRRKVGPAVRMTRRSPWDIAMRDLKIEVKCSEFSRGQWTFNIHHGGVLDESADFYVFRLLSCPYWKAAIHLVIPAPIRRKTVTVTPRTLVTRWAPYVDAISQLLHFQPASPEPITAPRVDRKLLLVTVRGETKTVGAWLESLSLTEAAYRCRLSNGWSDEEALLGRPLGMSQAERRRSRIERAALQMRNQGRGRWVIRSKSRKLA